jgi:hypothetical protein
MTSGIVVAVGVLTIIALVLGIIIASIKKFALGIIAFSILFLLNIFSLLMPKLTVSLVDTLGVDAIDAITFISGITGFLQLAAYILLIIGIYLLANKRKEKDTLSH